MVCIFSQYCRENSLWKLNCWNWRVLDKSLHLFFSAKMETTAISPKCKTKCMHDYLVPRNYKQSYFLRNLSNFHKRTASWSPQRLDFNLEIANSTFLNTCAKFLPPSPAPPQKASPFCSYNCHLWKLLDPCWTN